MYSLPVAGRHGQLAVCPDDDGFVAQSFDMAVTKSNVDHAVDVAIGVAIGIGLARDALAKVLRISYVPERSADRRAKGAGSGEPVGGVVEHIIETEGRFG